MRIERVDVDGFGALSGSFVFPERGLALWATPNGSGKSSLARAVTAALYGAPGASGWIQLAFRLDDGTAVRVVRDLTAQTVEIADADGEDLSARLRPAGSEIGQRVFGLSRAEFEETFLVRHDSLLDTVGNATLLALAARSAAPEPPAEVPLPPPPPLPPRASSPRADRPADDDLEIFRTAGEELGLFAPGALPPLDVTIEHGDIHSDLTAGLEPETPPLPEAEEPEPDPDEPRLPAADRLRRLHTRLRNVERRHAARHGELQGHAERTAELQTESRRLSSLSGAEPQDLENLRSVLEGLKRVERDRLALVEAEKAYRARLESRGISAGDLQRIAAQFGSLKPDLLAFLRGYRQSDAIRRGTRALVRSEQRMDESKLAEIEGARDRAAKLALIPLVAALGGVVASLATRFLALPFVDARVALAAAVTGAAGGALLLWRARHLSGAERQQIATSQDRKRLQIQQLDEETREASAGLGGQAEEWKLDGPEALLRQLDAWEGHSSELEELEGFARRGLALQRESAALRTRMDRFAAARDAGETRDSSVLDPEQIYDDYVRYFAVRRELEEADHRSLELEADLADLEMDRADTREKIDHMLEEAGIEADRDLDEAVELFALRVGQDRGPAAFDPDFGEGLPSVPSSRTASLAARAEALLRRVVPAVRDLTLDEHLLPSLRADAAGEVLDTAAMIRTLSAGTVDQVCLALRLAIVETASPSGEKVPTFLDDPLVRADDTRHDCALRFLVEDASERGQVLLMTAHEVRVKWFLHQSPQLRDRITSVAPPPAGGPRPASAAAPSPRVSSSPR
jgi:energy-coupling factor transporter ATP-binding protein EcfA2